MLENKLFLLTSKLTASDNLQFRFATDGEGNYGYLGADDCFIPFKSKSILLWSKEYEKSSSERFYPQTLYMDLTPYNYIIIDCLYHGGEQDDDKPFPQLNLVPIIDGQISQIFQAQSNNSHIAYRKITTFHDRIEIVDGDVRGTSVNIVSNGHCLPWRIYGLSIKM